MSSVPEDVIEDLETTEITRKKTRSSGRVKKATAKSSSRASNDNKVKEPENVMVISDTPETADSMCETIVLEKEQESVLDHRGETQSNGVESTEMEGIEEAGIGKEGSDEFIKQSVEDEMHVSETEVPELEDEPPPNVSSPVVPTVRSGLRLRTSDTSLSAEETGTTPTADPDDDIQEVPVEKAAVDVIEVPDDMDTDHKEADSSQQEVISSTSDETQNRVPIVLDGGELEKEEEQSQQVAKTTEEPETEMVSEDELPTESSKEPETEAVSDEELPANADLLETEAVSEDELPPDGHKKRKKGDVRLTKAGKDKEGVEKSDDSATCENKKKKRKKSESTKKGEYDPSSPTSEASNDDASPSKKSVKEEKVQSSKPKALPELEKYWKAVKDDSTDFTGWTYLLQYVDQENDVDAAREAYDAFLSHYPYCYGYWRKYADYEKRKNNKAKSEEVFERGLKAIPLSVDLWLHYLNYCKATYPDDEEFIRKQFDNALDACGLEFRSDRLWDSYIKWEAEGKRLQNVTAIYDRVLAVPTQGHTTHFESFQEHVSSAAPNKVLSIDEFLSLRREVKQLLKQYDAGPGSPGEAAPPGDDDAPPGEEPLGVPIVSDEETTALRERVVAIRRKVHKANVAAVGLRWTFEEGIKRPYFHVKPLERCQLKNWRDYIDFEIGQGDQKRIIMLFERCLIACALYDDFWMKFVRYLEEQTDDMSDKIRSVYERACTIHHPKKPHLHLQWAIYEEEQKCHEKASEILCNLEKAVPTMILVAFRRISVERRRGNTEGASTLYEHYIANMKNKQVVVALVIKYARYCWKVLEDVDRAIGVLKKAVEKDKVCDNNPRLYLQLIDMLLQKSPIQETEVIAVMDQFLSKETVEIEQKAAFAQRKVEFLEDFGTDVKNIQKAVHNLQDIVKAVKEKKKKMHEIESKAKQDEGSHVLSVTTGGSKRKSSSSAESSQQNTAASSAYGYNTTTPGYTGGGYTQPYQGGQYPQQPSYTQPPYNQTQYNQSDPNYANYQNWGYGNYNQGWGNYNYY